jgi:tripartite-type tricarboxylate transporter receptor subunit TctC
MIWRAVLVLLTALAAGSAAAADEPPSNRPIRVIIPFPAGGTLDLIVRPLADQLTQQMGRPWVIDNKPGANGIIGGDIVAKSAPDGLTLLAVTASIVVNPHIYRNLPFDVRRDLAPVTLAARGVGYFMVVHPSVPARNVQELIALDRKPGSSLAFSSPGVGNTLHLAAELFNVRAGTHMLHVPYKGIAPAITAALGGEVQVAFMPPVAGLEHIRKGALRPLAFTADKRWSEMPELPTVEESGVADYVVNGSWVGFFAAAGTPRPLVERLSGETQKALRVPKIDALIRQGGYEPEGTSPQEFASFVTDELGRYADAVKAAKIEQQ